LSFYSYNKFSFNFTANTTGTAANGLGTQLLLKVETTANSAEDAGAIAAIWTDATDASRTSKLSLSSVYSTTTNALVDLAWTTATATTVSIAVSNSNSNVGLAIAPKGTGALTAHIPDGTATGGNARGDYSVDLQTQRTNATDVASGANSTIPGGRRCTASADYSFATGFRGTASGAGSVAFGGSGAFSLGATASGTNSFAMGPGATASGTNSWAYGSGFTATAQNSIGFLASSDKYGEFAGNGWSFAKLTKSTITGTAATELFLDDASLTATIPSGEKWIVEIACLSEITVVGNGTGGLAVDDTYAATYRCVIANKGGTTALIGTVQADMAAQSDATVADTVFTITADNTGDYLKVTYTGGANTGTTTQANAYATLRIFKY